MAARSRSGPHHRRGRALALAVGIALSLQATAPALAADPRPSGTGQVTAKSAAGDCRVTLTDVAVEGTPYRAARRVDFPNGRAACKGTWLENADMWMLEGGRLRLGRNVGPGQFDFLPLKRRADGGWRHPIVTLTRVD